MFLGTSGRLMAVSLRMAKQTPAPQPKAVARAVPRLGALMSHML